MYVNKAVHTLPVTVLQAEEKVDEDTVTYSLFFFSPTNTRGIVLFTAASSMMEHGPAAADELLQQRHDCDFSLDVE